jgi:hypothetical protein
MRSQLFLKILNRLKYGKNDQRVTPEPLMRKHKTGSAKHGGIVQIAHQRFGLCAVADLREIFCRNDKENRAGIRPAPTTETAMAYSHC